MGSTSSSNESKGGCGGCVLAVLGLFAVIAFFYYLWDIHGVQALHASDESSYDPIASFPEAEALADAREDGLEFVHLSARFVRSDGTMDLTADYAPTALYQWSGANDGSRPLGAGGEKQLLRTVRATDFGFELAATLPGGEKYYDFNLGLRRSDAVGAGAAPAPKPTCGFAKLWKEAIARGADANAVAVINYGAAGYHFQIDGTPFQMSFGNDCKPKK